MIISNLEHVEVMSETAMVEGGLTWSSFEIAIADNFALLKQEAAAVNISNFFGKAKASNFGIIDQTGVAVNA